LSNEEKTNDYENFEKGMIYMKIFKKGGRRKRNPCPIDFLGPVFLHKEATFHKLVASCVLCPAMLAKNPHMILRHIKF
jgi:hypothetical protein